MIPVDDLAEWLTQIWDEQEKWARKAGGDEWHLDGSNIYRKHPTEDVVDWVYDDAWEHIAANDPASVLARIAADRQILATIVDNQYIREPAPGVWSSMETDGLAVTVLRLLALPYADRPGYQEAWKP